MGSKTSRTTAPKPPVSSKSAGSEDSLASTAKTSVMSKAVIPTAAASNVDGKAEKTVQPLGFRSWKTGTLDTPAFQPKGYTAKKVKPATASSALSSVPGEHKSAAETFGLSKPTSTSEKPSVAVSKITSLIRQMQELPTVNNTHHPKQTSTPQNNSSAAKSFMSINPMKKDFVINASGACRNRFHVNEIKLANGPPNAASDSEAALTEISEKSEADKKQFWLDHHTQIIVDLRENSTVDSIPMQKGKGVVADTKGKGKAEVIRDTFLDHMAKLGDDFFKYATRITVDLVFPSPSAGSIVIRQYGQATSSNNPNKPNFTLASNTAGFKIVEELVTKLDGCANLKFLEVIINNPNASNANPFTVDQLMYGLPFYELHFADWEMKWKDVSMATPFDVGRFPINIMDKERSKLLWTKKNAEREAKKAELKEQERISKMVFVTPSVAPQYQPRQASLPQAFPSLPHPFPEPFPAAAGSSVPKQSGQSKQ